MADTVFQVEVGAKYSTSTLKLKTDIQNILNDISKTPPQVTVGLAKTSSKRQINADLNEIFKNTGKTQYGITLGLKGGSNIRGSTGKAITKDLLAITSMLNQQQAAKVTVHIDTAATQKAMLAELKKLDLGVTITANGGGGNTDKQPKKTRDALFGNAATAQKGIYDTQATLAKTDQNDSNYQVLTDRLNRYKTSLAQLKSQANQEFGVSDAEFNKEVAGYEKVAKAVENCKTAYNDAAKAAEERKAKAAEQAETEYQALVKSAAEIQKKIYALKTENSKSGQNDANVKLNEDAILEQKRALTQKMAQAATQFGIPASQFLAEVNGFEKVTDAATKYTKALNDNAQAQKNSQEKRRAQLDSELTKYTNKTESLRLKVNESTAGASKYLAELQDLYEVYKMGMMSADEYSASLRDWSKRANEAGVMAESAGERFSRMFGEKVGYAAITLLLNQVQKGLRQIYTNVVELDTGMTELKKVTDETDATYTKFLDNAASRAKALGSTMSNVVNATASFARLGYSLEEASELADAAVVYEHVGDEVESIDDASNSVISTMQAFEVEVKNVMTIADKFNTIGKQNCPAA